jgi:hypothetical protein
MLRWICGEDPREARAPLSNRELAAKNWTGNCGGLKSNDVAHVVIAVPDDEFQIRIVPAFAMLEFANDEMPVVACRIVIRQIR